MNKSIKSKMKTVTPLSLSMFLPFCKTKLNTNPLRGEIEIVTILYLFLSPLLVPRWPLLSNVKLW